MPEPRVSVVVSTYNRPERLDRLLVSLGAQTLPGDSFEVVVVDNGSPGTATAAILAAHDARSELQLRWLRHEVTRGPAGGRNSGWRLARAPLVAFTDDDCVPRPSWLAAGLAAANEHPGAIIQGPTRPEPCELERSGLFSHTVRIERLGPQYETCNIFYPRAALESVGGFDESFGLLPAGEDTDLAWRVLARGGRSVFAPEAEVYHAVEPIGPRASLRVAARWCAAVRLFRVHPDTRSMLYNRMFWNVWHYLLWRSVLALAAPAWLRRLLWARHLLALHARAGEAGAGISSVPFLLVHDAVESWAVARGAVRYRTFVL